MAHSIITVATMKGGSGKSTLASCLAAHWQINGRNAAIIDADPQRTIARLAAREKALGGVHVAEDDHVLEHFPRVGDAKAVFAARQAWAGLSSLDNSQSGCIGSSIPF